MFSRDSRRRNKEAFLQKIGAHAKGDDERFLRKVQQHGDLEQRVYDAQRATWTEKRMAGIRKRMKEEAAEKKK